MSTADTLPDLRLFGEPALQLGGRWFAWRREQRFRLLGYLAVEARPVDRDELACLFWPDEPAEAARRNLRKTLFRLRPWLAEVGVPWANDTAGATGLADGASLQWLGDSDLQRLRQALVRADAVAAAGLCNGPLLQGLDGGSNAFQHWLDQARERSTRQWRDLVLQLLAGPADGLPALDWTERLVAQDALDEPAMRARVRALCASGQVAAARQCHARWRQGVHDELGLATPDDFARLANAARPPFNTHGLPPDQGLPRDITGALAGDGLATPPVVGSAPADPVTQGAPQYLTAFVGRAAELAQLQAWLAGPPRPITVLGAPGCGKTRLAAELFNRQRALHPGARQAFVELDRLPPGPLASAAPGHAELVAHIAQALGLALAGDVPSPERLAEYLGRQPTLLLLDNFEHRLGDQPLLARLQRVPGLRLVITSRVRLALDADTVLALDGLPVEPPANPGATSSATSDALRLFEARCRQVQGAERDDALQLCRLLQGQPLAIELAARTCRALPPADLAQRLAADLDSLATHALDLPPRQRSLRAAFDTHWQLLPDALRDALRRLSVLRADFSAGSARAVAGLTDADIAALIDHSLLRATPEGARLRWHPFVREFTFQHLQADASLARRMQRAHVAHFSAQLQRLGADETRPSRAALHYLATEAENLAEAWRHALALDDRTAQRALAEALTLHHEFQARCVEGAALLEGADEPAVALLRARLLHWAAPHRAEAIADAAHAAVLAAGDVAGQIAAARVRGLVAWRRGAPQLAVQHFQAGLALGLQHGQPAQRAILLDGLGLAMADLGDADGARAAFSEALALNDATGNDLQAVQNLINLSLDARRTAPPRAQALAQRALALCQEIGFAHYQPHAQVALSLALSAGGQAVAARSAVDAALAATRQSGDDYAECWAGVALAQACRAAGDADGARAATHRGLGQAWRLGDASLMAQHLAEAGAPDDGRPLAQRVHEVLGRLA